MTTDKPLCIQLQQSSVTASTRNDHCIQLFASRALQRSVKQALSFGCSKGYEISSLLTLFPTLELAVGVDINLQNLLEATEMHQENIQNGKVKIMNSQELEDHMAVKSDARKFDIVTVFNVLCRFYSGRLNEGPILFDTFVSVITMLIDYLNPGGILCVYGANYSVKDISTLPSTIELVPIGVNSGPVPVFFPNGQTRRPRGNDLVYAIRKKIISSDIHSLEQKVAPKQQQSITTNDKSEQEAQQQAQQQQQQQQQQQPDSLLPPLRHVKSILRETPTITFGILRPGDKSKNLGDFTQALSALNVLSIFYTPEKFDCSATFHSLLKQFAKTKPFGTNVRNKHIPSLVRVVWIDRDNANSSSHLVTGGGKIYVISNGWFMHAQQTESGSKFQLPFPDFVVPLFVSMHIARPELLEQKEVVAYLQKHQPIGCRDESTVRLMNEYGVNAYFSSCLTTTLEMDLTPPLATTATNLPIPPLSGHLELDTKSCNVSHIIPEQLLIEANFDGILDYAFRMLQSCAHQKTIDATRIHTLLPTRAASSIPKLTFCSKSGSQDASWMNRSRFSGLTRMMEFPVQREIRAMALFAHITDWVAHILFGEIQISKCKREHVDVLNDISVSTNEERVRWLRLQHPASLGLQLDSYLQKESSVRAAVSELDQQLIVKKKTSMSVSTEPVFEQQVVIRRCSMKPFSHTIDLLVTFDKGYIDIVSVFLRHLSANNADALLRVWCATRQVESLTDVGKIPNNVILYHFKLDSQIHFPNYQSVLKHVSNVCMDRLIVEKLDFGLGYNDIIERVIYIDLDIAVIGSLKPLLQLDSGNCGVIAKSSVQPFVINKWIDKMKVQKQQPESVCFSSKPQWREYKHSRSLNAGVLVFDISKIRQKHMFDFCVELYEATGYNDQMCLSFYTAGAYKELPSSFNVFVGQDSNIHSLHNGLLNSANVLHFVGSHKPWLAKSPNEYIYGTELYMLWHKYQKSTSKARKHVPG